MTVVGALVYTDAGMACLDRLPQLQELEIDGDEITDAAMDHIKGLTRLTRLQFMETRPSAAARRTAPIELPGLKHPRQPQRVTVSGTGVTDNGLSNLAAH